MYFFFLFNGRYNLEGWTYIYKKVRDSKGVMALKDQYPNNRNSDYGYRPGLLTRAKFQLRRIVQRLAYRFQFKIPQLPRMPRLQLSPKFGKRLIQTAVSVMIFIIIMGVYQLEYQWAQGLKNQIRVTLSHERDYTANIKDYLTFGWWINSYDRMVFTNRNQQLAVPVVSLSEREISPPVTGTVVKRFGLFKTDEGQERFYEGIAIEAALGSSIVSVLDGKVVRVTEDPILGRLVQIDHGEGLYTLYAYCSEILVKEGQEVVRNQVIGKVGETGAATSPMLYFEMRERGELVDPLMRLRPSTGDI